MTPISAEVQLVNSQPIPRGSVSRYMVTLPATLTGGLGAVGERAHLKAPALIGAIIITTSKMGPAHALNIVLQVSWSIISRR